MIKAFKITILLTLGGLIVYFAAKVTRALTVVEESTQLQTAHFLISYQGIYANEAEAIANALEANYERIRSDLQDPPHDNIHVHIHPSQQAFNTATGLVNSTANGTSRGPDAFHFIWTNWYNSIFPDDPQKTAIHEFTHCVQLNILIEDAIQELNDEDEASFNAAFEKKFAEQYPQWFWEALCTYEAKEVNIWSVKYGMHGKPGLQTLNSSNQIYNVGYSLIEYLESQWGKEKLPEFIRSYCDFEKVLGVTEKEFERGWYEFVEENY